MNRQLRRALAALAAAAALAGCSARPAAGRPEILPTFSYDCRAPGLGARARPVIPVRAVRRGEGAFVVGGICVDGKGPFTFLIDTGSSSSLIDVRVASRLGLATVGKVTGSSFGCRRSLSTAYLDRWTLGGRSLKGQWVAVGEITSHALPNLMGLLGADLLSRFGAVRLDYTAQAVTMGTEGALTTSGVPPGRATPRLPGRLSRGVHQAVPMDVLVASDLPLGLADLSAVKPEVAVS